MLLSTALMAACAIPLALGRERRSARAWLALGAMLTAMLVALPGSAGSHLLGGAVALIAAPVVVAGAPRAAAAACLHRSGGLLIAALLLVAGAGGIADPASHHGAPDPAPILVAALVAVVVVALGRRPAVATLAEVALMAAGLLLMIAIPA